MLAFDIIPSHPTWQITDSSKLTTYMRCPRKYFYEYILGWRPDFPNNHLVFGTAWHAALEHMLNNDYSLQSLTEAKFIFMHAYREVFNSETDEIYAPKTPKNALIGLENYYDKYSLLDREYEILYTEIGGQVLITNDHTIAFKMDAILKDREKGTIIGLDHKTSQRRSHFIDDEWTLSMQMLLYLHVLHCIYGENAPVRMQVRTSFFYESKQKGPNNEFHESYIVKTPAQMQAWLARIHSWVTQLEIDKHILEGDSDDAPTMDAFPGNDTACFNFGQKCAYFDFCDVWSNPLQRCSQVPLGFKVERWNPLELPQVKTLINLVDIKEP